MEDPDTGSFLASIILDAVFKPFAAELFISLAIMLLLLLFSALISGSEIAFFSLDPPQLHELKANKDQKNSTILKLLETPRRLLATILIANNFVNVGIVILSTYITSELFYLEKFPVLAFVVQVIVVTSMILLFGEIIPKVYATQYPVKFARFMSKPLRILLRIFSPLSSLLVNSTNFIDRRLANRNQNFSMDELSQAIDIATDEDSTKEEKQILKGIVKFGDIEVKEIMKSRTDVTAVSVELDFKELLDLILDSGYSRIPAFSESFDNITGILYIKDLLPYLGKGKDFRWQELLRPAFFVPENKKINDLLKEIQEKKIHMAVVVDEYGGTSGLVTLEDILEEIVGEISDEFDVEEEESFYEKIDKNNFIFEGKTSLNDMCKVLEIEPHTFDKVKGDSDSLAGLILELEGKIPGKLDNIKFDKFVFKILEADHRRIKSVRVSLIIEND